MLAQSGKTFRDGDGDGIKDSGEAGIPGVLVKSYINNGAGDLLLGQAVSNDTGFYNLTPPAGAGQKVRIEFQIPANACNLSNAVDFSSLGGQNYGSSVQFVTGPATNVHFAILNADAYVVSANPRLFVPCYVNGSNAKNTTSGNLDALVSYGYNSAGVPMMDGGTAPNPVPLAHGSSIGTVWGTAYSRQAKRLFTAAFLKRHSGLGPAGSGGIYLIDPANPPPTGVVPAHVSLDSLGFPTQGGGAYVATPTGFNPNIGSSANRGLPVGGPTPNADPSAFGQVGKVSLGGLDLSSDGRYLFTINLYDRKLYRLDLTNANAPVLNASTPVKQYNALPWLTAQCDSGMARPFAVKYYRGKVYVGVVCTGELKKFPRTPSLKRYADALRAYVYEIDPVTEAATVVLNFPLNYQKETLGSGAADSSPQNGWFTWSDNYRDHYYIPYCCGNQGFVGYNQPMLSDLEFDSDGSLILAFMDRGGHQWGFENFDPDGKGPGANGSGNYDKVTGGDILRTFKNPQTCTYQLEANGVAGPYTSTSLNPVTVNGIVSGTGVGTPNGTGLSFTGYTTPGKEFYWGDYAFIFGNNYPNPHHNEGIMGGLAIWPSSGEVIATGLDPVQNVAYSGGTYRLDNSTGARNIPTGYNIYSNSNTNPTFGLLGKANGLGDTEITGDVPPLEVGNRLWKDLDGDGIQDPDE
ncbi:MAG: hypothetical protein LH606_07240, partial [Cytophagaceae bacterium]|nr:hypothetical protein [Cytophagaceae bacterium]